jgi:hypothetical protein
MFKIRVTLEKWTMRLNETAEPFLPADGTRIVSPFASSNLLVQM